MAKEITLEELARSSSNNSKPAARAEEINKGDIVTPATNIKTARPISTSDLGKNLEAQHPEAKKKVVEEDAPLVANAFASMTKTLEEKQRFIQEEMMPVVMENAREMAMEKELEELGKEESNEEDLDEADDFSELNEEEVVETKDDGVYTAPTVVPELKSEE
jgi:hypothetical protein